MAERFYITTPIYYVNASPHIGHSYTTIAADTISRYMRQTLGNENVWFLSGTDEHGQKIQKAAEEAGLSPQEFVDKVVVQFKDMWKKLNISYNQFIRTTDKEHIRTVQRVLEIAFNKEVEIGGKREKIIYPAQYVGWYCTPCETFWTEAQIIDQSCPDCRRPVEKISEVNYFFRLSAYQEWLIDYIENHNDFIRPYIRQHEVQSFLLSQPLNDLCISRPKERLGWGIPLPFSPDHVTYVWFDALINYISAVGAFDKEGRYISDWWRDGVNIVHLIGKDILRQHAVYWPIILHALGLRLPDTIFAHGWWMLGEDKMSKSRGNVVNPLEMVDKYGIDVYRYFLLRDVPFGLDGNFSEEGIVKRFNSDLANDLGNLVYRTLNMIDKYCQGQIPECSFPQDSLSERIKLKIDSLPLQIRACFSAGFDFNFNSALENIWELINMANKYVEQTKPWNLAKANKTEELKGFICLLVEAIRSVSEAIEPFMPQTSTLINEQLGKTSIKKGKPLFPRIDINEHLTPST